MTPATGTQAFHMDPKFPPSSGRSPDTLIITRYDAGAWATWGLERSSGRTPMDRE